MSDHSGFVVEQLAALVEQLTALEATIRTAAIAERDRLAPVTKQRAELLELARQFLPFIAGAVSSPSPRPRRQPIAAGDFPSIRGGSSGNSFIVCDDGSAFRLETDTGESNELLRVRWVELPPIPGTAADAAFGGSAE